MRVEIESDAYVTSDIDKLPNVEVVISQEFQNKRALCIARSFGIEAFGFNAQNVSSYGGIKTKGREFFARGKAFVELLFGVQPTYLGEKVLIP